MFKKWMMLTPFFDADTGATGGGEAAPAEPAAVPTEPTPTPMQNPLLTTGIYREEAPQQQATPAAPAPEMTVLDFGGRKVPVLDPVIEEVHRDYAELTRTFTQTSQAMKQLEAQNLQLQQMVQNAMLLQQQSAQPATPQAPAAPTAEEIEAQKEAFMEQFYENPMDAIRNMAQQLFESQVQPVIQPIQEEREFHNEARRLMGQYTDFQQTIPAMQQLTQTMPELEKLGLEKVYLLAKNMAPATPTPPEEPTTAVDPAADKQQWMNDPDVRQQIFNDMLREKQQQQAAVPPVMASQAGGAIPTIPQNKPTNIREGSKALMRHLGIPVD